MALQEVTREPHEVQAIKEARAAIRALVALHYSLPEACTPNEALETMQDWLRGFLEETAGGAIPCRAKCDGLFSDCRACLGTGAR